MTAQDISILSIAPYPFLPLRNGGHQAIAKLHHYLGSVCNDHVVSTDDNGDNTFSFTMHGIFPDRPLRYFPGYGVNSMLEIAEQNNSRYIICEHPYMALSAMTLAHKLHIPWFIRSHNIESERFRSLGKVWWPILRKYERYAMHKSDGVFFITQEDATWAEQHFKLPQSKCHVIPFGTDLQSTPRSHNGSKAQMALTSGLNKDLPWLYFLGALDYKPNEDAVSYILDEIHPRFIKAGIHCEILIAGKGLDEELSNRIGQTEYVHHMGFVDDLDIFLEACDIMLNPVMTGGGIKTKAVEALGYNKTVVSSSIGAAGLIPDVCGQKLLISEDYDWDAFVDNTEKAINDHSDIPPAFYDTYYHGNIAANVISILQSTTISHHQ
ncbi:MAG: glycosyltransferase family 4 protein [Chitinophagaceae bacterium]|nr:glycosyltransferase family 4 protein [Chitinophagaceae bacterium]MCB9045319.1 glycosyltransferase family 4 protein [Chitinophagales bacterium]